MQRKIMDHIFITRIFAAAALCTASHAAVAQAMYFSSSQTPDELVSPTALPDTTDAVTRFINELRPDSVRSVEELDNYLENLDRNAYDTTIVIKALPDLFFTPPVYTTFEYSAPFNPFAPEYSGHQYMRWIEEENAQQRTVKALQRKLFYSHPELVRYNIALLPEAPKVYHAVLNPEDHTIEIRETVTEAPTAPTFKAMAVKKKHWIRTFDALLQFSQAYVSPNWYQGGNNNLNMLANVLYNVKLNQEYHPNLLFETTAQYKLGMNNAPDDKEHNYSISEDLFQVNSTFGLKAARRWYYSVTGQFKTQFLNSYPANSRELKAAFLSPADLTVGLGMTYNYANPKKTVTFDASMAPLSYNMRICQNHKIDPAKYNIDNGRRVKHNFGSSAEIKFNWKITYNINYNARIFAFTDYDSAQADWENRLSFDINRFLSTQIYVHLRYDSSTPKSDDHNWKKLQVKEILSIGFSYKFKSI